MLGVGGVVAVRRWRHSAITHSWRDLPQHLKDMREVPLYIIKKQPPKSKTRNHLPIELNIQFDVWLTAQVHGCESMYAVRQVLRPKNVCVGLKDLQIRFNERV